MKIRQVSIKGFKSLEDILIEEPNPFTVFVGPNAAGKSNIFEAIEFLELCNVMSAFEVVTLFGSVNDILFKSNNGNAYPTIRFSINFEDVDTNPLIELQLTKGKSNNYDVAGYLFSDINYNDHLNYQEEEENIKHVSKSNKKSNINQFVNFTRLFVGNQSLVKRKIQDDSKLSIDASNLESVLKRILLHEKNRIEILELLQLLIPGFEKIEVRAEELSGTNNLLIYEQNNPSPFTKRLISDGTFNIISIIAAIYQTDEPQFICIEEPENGLNPKVIKELTTFFRNKCREKGHYIWLNTHSQTLVSELSPEEIVLVDKVNGRTQIKQLKGFNLHGMKMDEALLTNALGGGIPW